jgi:hypothetical protein
MESVIKNLKINLPPRHEDTKSHKGIIFCDMFLVQLCVQPSLCLWLAMPGAFVAKKLPGADLIIKIFGRSIIWGEFNNFYSLTETRILVRF